MKLPQDAGVLLYLDEALKLSEYVSVTPPAVPHSSSFLLEMRNAISV